jgi:hypothetical protein
MSRDIEDLVSVYSCLGEPSGSGDAYVAQAIHGRPRYRVAKDAHRNAAILVSADVASSNNAAAPLDLPNLSFRSRCVCRVTSEGKPDATEVLAVLKCLSDDQLLQEYFLRSVSGLVAALPQIPSELQVASSVSKLVELFRALEAPPRTSLQGLWCELFLITQASHIRQAAAAWHADPRDLYDFVFGRQRLEVKSSIGPHRSHHFLLDQLLPPHGTTALIASFILDESGQGTSIVELCDKVLARPELTHDLRDRLSKILALGLGHDWRKARRVAFDMKSADAQLRLYNATTVPKVDSNLPTGVTDVQFKSDMAGAVEMSRAEAGRLGGLFAALFS